MCKGVGNKKLRSDGDRKTTAVITEGNHVRSQGLLLDNVKATSHNPPGGSHLVNEAGSPPPNMNRLHKSGPVPFIT